MTDADSPFIRNLQAVEAALREKIAALDVRVAALEAAELQRRGEPQDGRT